MIAQILEEEGRPVGRVNGTYKSKVARSQAMVFLPDELSFLSSAGFGQNFTTDGSVFRVSYYHHAV